MNDAGPNAPDPADETHKAEAASGPPITELLGRVSAGERAAFDDLLPLVYEELRRLARRQIGSRRGVAGTPTLDTTALVHEAYLKLAAAKNPQYNDRCHFLAIASIAMRQILVDHARRRNAVRRGQNPRRVSLDQRQIAIDEQADAVIAIDEALERLKALNPRLARVVECTFFGDMTHGETAVALAVTERTIRRDWAKARAWLHRELGSRVE